MNDPGKKPQSFYTGDIPLVLGEQGLLYFAMDGCTAKELFQAISDIAYAHLAQLRQMLMDKAPAAIADPVVAIKMSRVRAITRYAVYSYQVNDIWQLRRAFEEIQSP